jgi:hypothetical protein
MNEALPEIHAVPQELGSPVICGASELVEGEDAADIIGIRTADLPRHHRLSLAHAFPGRPHR